MKIYFEGKGRSKNQKKEYRELLSLLSVTPAGKESRKLHKRLKAYGDGLDFNRRYPFFALTVSIVAIIVAILAPFILAFIEIMLQ